MEGMQGDAVSTERGPNSPQGLVSRHIAAVVVTYHPQSSILSKTIEATLPQVDELIVVDNASPVESLRAVPVHEAIAMLRLGENKGVAEAQNVGILEAKRRGATHVLLLDQDSLPVSDMVSRLLQALEVLVSSGESVAAVGPRWTNTLNGQQRPFSPMEIVRNRSDSTRRAGSCVESDTLISAGSLIPLTMIDAVGLMDARLFIDQVDTEWCLRARAKGFRVFGVNEAGLDQALGDTSHRIWLIGWRNFVSHKPFRYYYIFRNSVLLHRRPYIKKDWKAWNVVVLTALLCIYGVLVGPRVSNVAMMWRGLRDGFRGVTGRLDVAHSKP